MIKTSMLQYGMEREYDVDVDVAVDVDVDVVLQYGMEREYGEKQNYGSNLSCNSLHSDGDSYPNSPINGENKNTKTIEMRIRRTHKFCEM